MLRLAIIIVLFPITTFSQTENSPDIVWQKCVELYKQGKLDSIQTSIKQVENVFQLNSIKLFYFYTDTLHETDDSYSIGSLILDYHFEFNAIKIGEWTTYYPNGKLYSIGNYGIGAYTICKGQAPSQQGYSFKRDTWTYWYQNEKIMASGKFSLIQTNLQETSGVRKMFTSKTNKDWQFYDFDGCKLETPDKLIEKITNGG